MKGVSKTRFLSLLRGQCFDWFQIEVVIQVKVVKILSMDQQVEHVVTLKIIKDKVIQSGLQSRTLLLTKSRSLKKSAPTSSSVRLYFLILKKRPS